MTNFGVVLDACVIYKAPVRDTLLRAHAAGMYRALWTQQILDEATRNLVQNRRMDAARRQKFEQWLKTDYEEAFIEGYETLIPSMPCDPKDRHVLAAAVKAHAQVIVTENLRDFPEAALKTFGVEVQRIDEFLCNLYGLFPNVILRIIQEQSAALKRPPQSVERTLHNLGECAPEFARDVLDAMNRR